MASLEELVEDKAKQQLAHLDIECFYKTDPINSEIDSALKNTQAKAVAAGKITLILSFS